jgi:hypothetical protein
MDSAIKGTHARDFHSMFLNFFAFISDWKKRNTANIFENILKIRPDIWSFLSLHVFAESTKHGCALSPKTQS